MAEYTLEREYKIKNPGELSEVRINPSDEGGVRIVGAKDGSYSLEEANAIAHAIIHCIQDIQHFQTGVEEKLRPERVADRDGWTNHDGKDMPIAGNTLVEVKFRDGDVNGALEADAWHSDEPSLSNWIHSGEHNDIIRYRIVS